MPKFENLQAPVKMVLRDRTSRTTKSSNNLMNKNKNGKNKMVEGVRSTASVTKKKTARRIKKTIGVSHVIRARKRKPIRRQINVNKNFLNASSKTKKRNKRRIIDDSDDVSTQHNHSPKCENLNVESSIRSLILSNLKLKIKRQEKILLRYGNISPKSF